MVGDNLAEARDFLEDRLHCHVLLSTMALEGGECFGERREAVVVSVVGGSGGALGVVGIVVAQILHARVVTFVLGVFLNPELFEDMPGDKRGDRVNTVVFAEFILELFGVFDADEGCVDKGIGMEGGICLGGKHLLAFNVAEEAFDGGGWIPRLVEVEGKLFPIMRCSLAVAIIEINEDVPHRTGAESTLADAKGWFEIVGDGLVEVFLQYTVDNLMI